MAEIFSPSYLLFPAIVGTTIMGLVCPLIGAFLILRRAIFLGLTLPQIAAAGVSFTFWLEQRRIFPGWDASDRSVGMAGSLLFTFLGMGLLGYLEQRGKGLAEGRLAAAYALAGGLTILFIVFNPAGQIEVLNLLKGEVIALLRGELKALGAVFGMVLVALLLFRRELLLAAFDRDLAFLLKGSPMKWDVLLYLLAGLVIAVGVIMAGPLLIFGFLVLPALAARVLASSMRSFLVLSSGFGVAMAVIGFYSSIRLDLPLGPTDVTLGCGLIFLAYGWKRIMPRSAAALPSLVLFALAAGGCATTTPAPPVPDAHSMSVQQVWLAKVRNSTSSQLLLPAANPLRSLAEMAGKVSSDYRESVMEVLRAHLKTELEQRGFKIALPEQRDARFQAFPADTGAAVRLARQGDLSGVVFVSEIRRWEVESPRFVRVWVEFKVVRVDDGAVLWERRVQRAISTPSATHTGHAYIDAAREIVREIFGS